MLARFKIFSKQWLETTGPTGRTGGRRRLNNVMTGVLLGELSVTQSRLPLTCGWEHEQWGFN